MPASDGADVAMNGNGVAHAADAAHARSAKILRVAGSDADDYSDTEASPDEQTPREAANSAQSVTLVKRGTQRVRDVSAAATDTEIVNSESPSGPSFAERLAGFRDMFFRAFRVDTRLQLGDEPWEYTEEPHVTRRQLILRKHPEIKKLMGYDPLIAYIVVGEVLLSMAVCGAIRHYDPSWWLIVPAAYFIAGFINHSLGSAIHEIGHNLAFGHKRAWANRLLGILANVPIGIPMAISYRKYHQEHHRWLGHDKLDVDIPTRIEVALFRTPLTKMIWLIIHPIIHAFRPFYKSYKPIWMWEVVNGVVQIAIDLVIWYIFGFKALIYCVLGTLLGLGLHPLSGHFISEHYLFQSDDHQATHSYYGPLNLIMFNLGYHVEHHDFPYVPYNRLPELRRIAHEFYDPLPYHTSWCRVVWDFIWKDQMGPQARSVTKQCEGRPELYETLPSTQQFYHDVLAPHAEHPKAA